MTADVTRVEAETAHEHTKQIKIANDAAPAAKKGKQDATQVAAEQKAVFLNTKENDNDYLVDSDEDKDKESVASEAMLSSEASVNTASG